MKLRKYNMIEMGGRKELIIIVLWSIVMRRGFLAVNGIIVENGEPYGERKSADSTRKSRGL